MSPHGISKVMHVAHILRKLDEKEWGGTETVLQETLNAWQSTPINSFVFAPVAQKMKVNFDVIRYRAILPIMGISKENRSRLISIGGNILSFDLGWKLYQKTPLSIVHAHCLGHVAAIGEKIARLKGVPFVLSLHGGALDLSEETLKGFVEPGKGGVHWGKLFSPFLRADRLLNKADAIFTYNPKEEALLKEKFPEKNILLLQHGIYLPLYEKKLEEHPLQGHDYCLISARIDPVKNQLWLIEQIPLILKHFPSLSFVFAGAVTDPHYKKKIDQKIKELGVHNRCLFMGSFVYDDPKLVALLQHAKALLLPSIAEPFGKVILEAWAANTPVIASAVSGPASLIEHKKTGWLFNVNDTSELVHCLEEVMKKPQRAIIQEANQYVKNNFSIERPAKKILETYSSLIKDKSHG